MGSIRRMFLFGMALIVLPACSAVGETPSVLPSPEATTATAPITATSMASPQPPATATATPSDTATSMPTSTATATVDTTRSADMTLEAIRMAVTASGVPEGSDAFDAQVAATQCANVPPPTSTPLPWQLAPQQPFVVSANCLGNDLPGNNPRIWQEGKWFEAQTFLFANSADLGAAQQRYAAYLALISFHDTPPTDGFTAQLANLMNSANALPSPGSCLADAIEMGVSNLVQHGSYARLTFKGSIRWSSTYYLYLSPSDIQLALPWPTGPVLEELVPLTSSTPLRQATLPGLSGTARFSYDAANARWMLADDDGGYYCNVLPMFVK